MAETAKEVIQIPFNKAGMLHYPDPYPEKLMRWLDNHEFTGTLTLDGMERGCSAAHFTLHDTSDQRYTMFMKDLLLMVQACSNMNRGTITGRWTYVKRGMNYGVKFVGE